jgi:hypothetical protein
VERTVDLQLDQRPETDGRAGRRHGPQVAAKPRGGKRDIALVGDASLDEHSPGANHLRVFGHERPLLCEDRRAACREQCQTQCRNADLERLSMHAFPFL